MHIHIVGVAGTGMATLAGLLVEAGHRVTGSDVAFHAPMGPALASWNVECRVGFDPAHLEPAPDLVVIGNVCRKENPEAKAAFERKLQVTHIAGALRRFALENRVSWVVAGTHGKTTTSSLCAWLAERAEQRPGFFIGGIAENFGRGFRLGAEGAPFVIEGDEYDTAFFEKTAKFLHYGATHAIVTSIEHDHVDIYPDARAYERAFEQFVGALPKHGVLVANAGDPAVRRIVQSQARCNVHWYGKHGADFADLEQVWTAQSVEPGVPKRVNVWCKGQHLTQMQVPLLGEHNVQNALAAVLSLHQSFGVPLEQATRGLHEFLGSKRRQERLGTPGGVFVYDDFAHHPSAVRETLAALRDAHPKARLWVAFEPRSATACRAIHQHEYSQAFDAADHVLLAPVARTELSREERLDTRRLASDLERRNVAATACESTSQVLQALLALAQPGDCIALLSNGPFGGIHRDLLTALELRQGDPAA